MHKVMAKKLFICEKIRPPPSNLPAGGSPQNSLSKISLSFSVRCQACQGRVYDRDLRGKDRGRDPSGLEEAGKYDGEILIEAFMKGKEITVGILEDIPLPIIEVVPKSGFYDYRSKYTKGETEYILPAPIPREKYLAAQEISLQAFRALGCSGCARVDLMTDEDGNPFVIDVNTMPGMTENKSSAHGCNLCRHPIRRFGRTDSPWSILRNRERKVEFRRLEYGRGCYNREREIPAAEKKGKGKRRERFLNVLKKAFQVAVRILIISFLVFHRHRVYVHSSWRTLFQGEEDRSGRMQKDR